MSHKSRNEFIDETIEQLVASSSIPANYAEGRYFKFDATSPEHSIHQMLSCLFEKILLQGEEFKDKCRETYPILGRRQEVLLSLLVAFIIYVGPGKVCTTAGSRSKIVDGKVVLARTNENGKAAYDNSLFTRESVFAAMKFGNRKPSHAAEGFLQTAGSFLGAVVNRK